MRRRLALIGVFALATAAAAAAQYAPGRIEIDEFRKLHAAGKVLVVDVRDDQSFQNGHIPGSINIPLGEHERAEHFNKLKIEKRPIVTYCA
jgi:rhodanese-related sulfurtransferase